MIDKGIFVCKNGPIKLKKRTYNDDPGAKANSNGSCVRTLKFENKIQK